MVVARSNYLFTSESVSEGHPDKVCDRISDAIVDAFFARRRPWLGSARLRVACETLATTNRVVIAGEVRGPAAMTRDYIDARRPRWRSATSATSRTASTGRPPRSRCCCTPSRPTSPRASTPAGNKDEGAGDQGIMFGYACRETPELMPAPIYYAHRILQAAWPRRATPARRTVLGPDAKSQVTVHYENGKPVGVDRDRASRPSISTRR